MHVYCVIRESGESLSEPVVIITSPFGDKVVLALISVGSIASSILTPVLQILQSLVVLNCC